MAFSGTDDVAKLKMDSRTTLKADDIRIEHFEFTGKAAADPDSVMDRIAKAADQAQQTSAAASASIKLGDFDTFDVSSLSAGLGNQGPEVAVLREVRGLMSQEKYGEALAKLDELFELNDTHHEGLYLKAVSHERLEERIKALRVLSQLDGYQLVPRLQTRVRNLRITIRDIYVSRAAQMYRRALKSKDTDRAIRTLDELVQVDADCGKYFYFLAALQMVSGDSAKAIETARGGLEVCTTDRAELETFLSDLESRFLTQQLLPARKHFRQGKRKDCLAALNAVPAEARNPLWKTFHGYAEKLAGGGGFLATIGLSKKKPADTVPPGPQREADALYEFLVAPEMKEANEALEGKKFNKAEKALNQAITLTPPYPTANLLYANCVYRRVGDDVRRLIGQDIEDTQAKKLQQHLQSLRSAGARATVACNDRALTDAPRLAKSVNDMTSELEKVLKTYEDRKHDASIVNAAVDQFIDVLVQMLTAVSGGINSRGQLERLYRSMKDMDSGLASKKRRCHTAEARELMDQLSGFVRPQLKQLQQVCNQLGIY